MTESALVRARAGDGEAFRELTEPYRREIQLHCYRILGSVQDAEDMVQETLLAAWRGLEGFEERASMRAWLYRIATNRCLNVLRDTGRRPQPPSGTPLVAPEPTRRSEPTWFEPYPDALLEDLPDASPGPEARYESREALALAFVAGLQRLPPRQRAVLVLRDVLGFRAAEVADLLDSSEASVNSALQRARAALDGQLPAHDRDRAPLPRSPRERELVGRFVDAFESSDVDRLVALLTDDAWLTMPPEPLEYQGHAAIARFYLTRNWWGGQAVRLVPTHANGQPAFGCYLQDPRSPIAHAYGLVVLTLEGDRISAITRFGDNSLLPLFGLPRTLR
ncbi:MULTISPECIES: sigma-70 family RNA polymerase sigma factor [Micromonospora]|uniref:sigma-70 family RNA polymerase sigma factor n=1 Tax=Micromonospora TaxID=1873 RepID=UPI001EF10AC1|nr:MULTISPECIES: sigma-70 family RNA polymerase sigma factor [unclassified Micromonospora]